METKLFEIRDSLTFIPILCIVVDGSEYLLRRAGYMSQQIIAIRISGGNGQSTCDPLDWGNRTMVTAHEYIRSHWSALKSGDVIDVEFILGETTEKKTSEQFEGIEA